MSKKQKRRRQLKRAKQRKQIQRKQTQQPQESQTLQEPQERKQLKKQTQPDKLRQQRRRREKLRGNLPFIIGGVVVIAILGFFGWRQFAPRTGEAVPIQPPGHIEVGTEHAPYSNPPTSGAHYTSPIGSGFYNDPIEPEFLVHSLEHGYAVIWYNCDQLETEEACSELESQLRSYVNAAVGKLIGVPYPPLEVPLAISTWGRVLTLEAFDEQALDSFIQTNSGKDAPEPFAP